MKFGSGSSSTPLAFEPGTVTIFVGPNNSGKSLLLREIEQYTTEQQMPDTKIIASIAPQHLEAEIIDRMVEERRITPPTEYGSGGPGAVFVRQPRPAGNRSHGSVNWIRPEQIKASMREVSTVASEQPSRREVFHDFLSLFVIRLDGLSRFELTQPQPAGDLMAEPQNHLMAIFQDQHSRERMREITYEAFREYFVLDPTNIGQLRIRFASRPPEDSSEEQNWDDRTRSYHSENVLIDEKSDGVKAFTGLVATLLSDDYRIMLVDEPEAFLHPVLVNKLGARMTKLAAERGANVFASTHSSEFLMGCVEAGDVNVVRLTYKNEVATARHLPADELRELTSIPLLRSTGILSGLFYEGVIVSENDTDRVIYQEVNNRLLGAESGGASDTLFVNAYEKSTLRRIIEPLRNMGIPAAAITDLDIIKNNDFGALLKSAAVPEATRESLNTFRGRVNQAFERSGLDMKKDGVESLPDSEKEDVQNLINATAEYGIFIVPVGELERWFHRTHSLPGQPRKSSWVPWILDLMNTRPELFAVEEDDIWAFLRKVGGWIENPERKGIPS
ncbi:hypothetical protein BH24ACT16_BH24ACT16_11210 [soil metagenome]